MATKAKQKKQKTAPKSAADAAVTVDEQGVAWSAADKDYRLALDGGKLVCQNPKGKRLASVPKWLKDSDQAQQLLAVRDWLEEHVQECRETVESWLLRSLPVPREVLSAVWPDEAWQGALGNLVVCPVDKSLQLDQDQAGFLRDVDADKGVGVVDLDGETQWLTSPTVALPHPILLSELDDFRSLAAELEFSQQVDQLFRETWFADDEQKKATEIKQFEGGRFEQLNHVLGLCRRIGYRVRGGNAVCTVWEGGRPVEARFWIGADYPEGETWTGELVFVDQRERTLPVADVGPVAFSEGMRMAAAIYSKRVVKSDDEDE